MTTSHHTLDSGTGTDLTDVISRLGGEPDHLHLLDEDGPDLLPYATLLTARKGDDSVLRMVSAVYEWQSAPLLFLVPEEAVPSAQQLQQLRRVLAMRGDAPYLGVVGVGRLEVYRIALDSKTLPKSKVDWAGGDAEQLGAFARLSNLRPQAGIHRTNWISSVLLKLITDSIDSLITKHRVSHEDAISLIGRALFVRFLADRRLLPTAMVIAEDGGSLFDHREVAESTSDWLDRAFNGDLLPLSSGIFDELPLGAYSILGNVLRRAPNGNVQLGWQTRWANLDFAHIPVGVLSQAYELYLRKHAPEQQKKEGGYYTPSAIADLMVRASFRALERQDATHQAKVLDPAAGAGVFLLTAFRELVREHWRATGTRPTTKVLRTILYEQIVGFDINESALRFAALGLYLLSIELDPNPVPVDRLKFKNLRGTVLHRVSDSNVDAGEQLGSLGSQVGDEHVGRYDLVVGNPPWASSTGLTNWELVTETVARISATRRDSEAAPPLPNQVLDLPFVWRAMEWAKRDGQIAFALHGRFLFQQGEGMSEARQALFEALDVTSVINGAELRQTKVWPGVSAPFCILFATNRSARNSAGFRLISPRVEDSLNDSGVMRIDTANGEVVAVRQLAATPEILKIMFRGSSADLSILERIWSRDYPTLRDFWKEAIGERDGKSLWGSGVGYQNIRKSSRVRQFKKPKPGQVTDDLPGVSAEYLWGMSEVTLESFGNVPSLGMISNKFSRERLHDPRHKSIFLGPLVIIHKSPPSNGKRINVIVREEDTVYSETFYGYSTRKYNEDPVRASELATYIACILGSKFTLWFVLMVSGEFGVERDVIEKLMLDRMPLPRFENVDRQIIIDAALLMKAVESGEKNWDAVDEWVAQLYELSPRDWQVINDTLEFNLPFAENKQSAQAVPSTAEQQAFCQMLSDELAPWCKRLGAAITVQPHAVSSLSPWLGVVLQNAAFEPAGQPSQREWEGLVRVADDMASSELLIRSGEGNLLIGRLAQRRYWSATQARLLAQRIVGAHLDLFRARALS